MAYTLTQARKLLTAAELTVFEASRAGAIRELAPARLRAKLTRARALRDKFRDLHRRQAVATRSAPAHRRSAVGGDNARTLQKADLFAEVLSRFEERMQRVEADAATAARKAAAKKASAKPVPLKRAVAKALQKKTPAKASAAPVATRSAKAPATPRAPRKAGSASAPLDVTPATQRGKVLRERPDRKAIQAHTSAQGRRAQGKRDAR